MTKRKIEYWVIPPDADGEFVANMEEVLETYEKAYDPDCPVVCMDEQPVQLIGETRVPIPPTKEHPERVDYEYERKGTASIFMFAEPLSGFRQATARPRRTKYDWAHEVAHLLDTRYADNERITLVCDNLNTHTKGAFYEAFPPEKARGYVRRIDFVYTPKHGSWLNVAECELSCMTSQCLKDRRIGEIEKLQAEITFPSGEPHLAPHGSLLPDFTTSRRNASWQTDDSAILAKSTSGDAYSRTGNVADRRSVSSVPSTAYWSSPSMPGGGSSPSAIKKLARFRSSKAVTAPKPQSRRALYQST